MTNPARKFVVLALAVSFAGCGASVPSGPKVYPVKGTVTKGGSPVKGVSVGFYPYGTAKGGTSGAGSTGDDGSFSVVSQFGPGLAEGSYKVTVTSPVATDSYSNPGKGGPKPLVEVPKKLTSINTTSLLIDVKPTSDNVVKVEF